MIRLIASTYLRPFFIVSLLATSMALAACASTTHTAPSYYSLPEGPVSQPLSKQTATTLWLPAIQISPYLNANSIVMQLNTIELHQAQQHLWADPLDKQLQSQLLHTLATALPQLDIRSQPPRPKNSPQLQITVERFQGHYSGHAVVSGYWRLLDAEGNTLSHQRFDISQALENDGYPALVKALGSAWTHVTLDIANILAQHLVNIDNVVSE